MNFKSFSFCDEILKGIESIGYQQLTPIQKMAIPQIRRGFDVLANAQTGTGKTAAFALPLMQKLMEGDEIVAKAKAKVLVLAPTRDLAEQIANSFTTYGKFTPLKVVSVVGGIDHAKQAAKLKQGSHIIVATPGRLIEQIQLGNVSLSDVASVVLDEADRMLDMGFIADIRKILQHCSETHQTLLFSATYPNSVKQFAQTTLKSPKIIQANRDNETASTVKHIVYPVEAKRKLELLSELICRKGWQQVLVFVNMKEDVQLIVDELTQYGVRVGVCHGDKTQGNRRRALREFKEGKTQILVATEVAARGLDIAGLPRVINFDLPYLAEDYVHRIGRTGRAGNQGFAISFVCREEEHTLSAIEQLIGERIKRIVYPGFEVSSRDSLMAKINKKPMSQRKLRANKASQYGAESQLKNRKKIAAFAKKK